MDFETIFDKLGRFNFNNRAIVLFGALTLTLIFSIGFINARWETDPENLWVSHQSIGYQQQSNFDENTVHPAMGVFTRYNASNILSLKMHFYKGEISGNDAFYPELMPVRDRNLSFKSPIYEVGLQAEITLISFGENPGSF